jgi:phosphatidylglycerophosphate synthase
VPWRVLLVGSAIVLAGTLGMTGAGVLQVVPATAGMLTFVLAECLIAAYWRRTIFGMANVITLARVVGTSWVAGLATQALLAHLAGSGQLLMIAIGAGCLILDGFDGRVARARHQTSAFGARFDMETDAALLMFLSLALPPLEVAGWWVVAIGAMRYASLAATWLVRQLRYPLQYSYARKVVAVVEGVTLLTCLALDVVSVIPQWLPNLLLSGALGALCWSFGRDVVWQLRQLSSGRVLWQARRGRATSS